MNTSGFFARMLAVLSVCAPALLWGGNLFAAELLMFERSGCPYCVRWDAEVAPGYRASAEAKIAPLRRVDITRGQPKDVALSAPVRFTPTFVLVDNGKELGRITGYFDNATFWGVLGKLMAELPGKGTN
ncbi:MAG: thioredoxin fold domain-containing protein [Beijerinckiaceae bacterium]